MANIRESGSWQATKSYKDFDGLMADASDVKRTLYRNHLVVIRGVKDLTPKQHVALARIFGTPEVPLIGSTIHPDEPLIEVLKRTGKEAEYSHSIDDADRPDVRKPSSFFWHADRSFLPRPSLATITHLVTAPPIQGDTEFLNTKIAYDDLDPTEKDVLKGVVGIHSYGYYHKSLAGGSYTENEVQEKLDMYPSVEHPLVQDHPVNGETVVYASPLTLSGFTDVKRGEEASEVLDLMLREDTEAYYAHAWEEGEIVLWDNYGVLHRGSPSHGNRELQRLTIAQQQ